MQLNLNSAIGRQRRLNQVGETITSIATPVAAYSLRSLTGGDPLAVRVRRSSNDASAEKNFTVSEINSGALLDHINKDVITEQSNFTSGTDSYVRDSHGTISREATYEGKSDVLNYTHTGGRFAFKKASIALERTSSYTIAFEYYADTAFNNQSWGVERSFPTGGRPTISSNSPTVVSDAWTSVTLNVPNGRTTGTQILSLRIEDQSSTSDYGTTTNGSVRVKNIVVTQTTGSGFITTWYDQSGNSNNATQTDTDKQPAIATNGSLLVDSAGLPEIDFDGIDDRFEIDFGSNLSQPNSILFVHQSDLTGDTNNEFFDELGGSVRTLFDTGSNKYRPFAGVVTDTGVAIDTNKNLAFAVYNGSSSLFAKNGTATSAINIGTDAIAQTSSIGFSEGTTNNYDGTMQEFIIYNSDQSSNRPKIETNIMNHYSIS